MQCHGTCVSAESPCRLHRRDTLAGSLTWRSSSRLLGVESLDAFKQLQGRAGVTDALLVHIHHLCRVSLGGVVGVGGSSSRAAVRRAAVDRAQQAVSWPYRRIPNTTASAELFPPALGWQNARTCAHTGTPPKKHTPVLASKGCPRHWGSCHAAAAGRPAGMAQGFVVIAGQSHALLHGRHTECI